MTIRFEGFLYEWDQAWYKFNRIAELSKYQKGIIVITFFLLGFIINALTCFFIFNIGALK